MKTEKKMRYIKTKTVHVVLVTLGLIKKGNKKTKQINETPCASSLQVIPPNNSNKDNPHPAKSCHLFN